MRPLLNPALRRVWRDGTTLQLGTDPERAVVLGGVDAACARVLEGLDGTRERHEIVAAARAKGVSRRRADDLLNLLSGAGALVDAAQQPGALGLLPLAERDRLAPDVASATLVDPLGAASSLGRRQDATVEVHGLGRVGAAVALLLAAAGIGRILPHDGAVTAMGDLPVGIDATEVGRRRDSAVRAGIARLAPSTRTTSPRIPVASDLAVVASTPTRSRAADDLLRAGVPHLFAGVRETVGIVGPFVLPGRSSCSRCLDLHRRDRDPSWPQVFAQLVDGGRSGRSATTACDSALATAVAAHAALHALAWIDHPEERPSAADATIEIALPEGRVRRRTWSSHPECGCRWEAGGEGPAG